MLLKQLIQSPITSSQLLVCDPFREHDQEELVKEVIGLANADVDGPRNILFGVNAGAVDGGGIVGITESAMADLKKAHRLISALIEPVLHLAFIYDRINGKVIGALEIDGCNDGPYIVGQNFSKELSRGQCWIREDRNLHAIQPADVARVDKPEPADPPAKMLKPPKIIVGFDEDPDCTLLEMDIPDTSNPPFAREQRKGRKPLGLKKTIKERIGTVTTQILRLGGVHKQAVAAESDEHGTTSKSDDFDDTEALFADADNHFYFEEKALQLNLSVCNKGDEIVENVSIKLGFPRLPGFDVADRLYTSPFDKRSQYEIRNLGYPQVERSEDAIMVRGPIDLLAADMPRPAFKCALRLAVGPEMQGKKIAILYTLRGQDKRRIGRGRLKIKFGKVFA